MHDSLSRRGFFLVAGAACALPSSSVAAPPPPVPRRRRKAVKIGMVHGDAPLHEKFALLQRLGFDGVELDSPGRISRDEVTEARDATGLAVHGVVDSVHWQQTLSDPDANVRKAGVAALETALRDAHAFGATTVLLVPAVVRKDVSYADAYGRSQAAIREVLPLARELGVRIALENVWNQFLLSPIEAARYVDEFESDHVGWYFDVGNVVTYGWPEHWIQSLGERILKVDVKEYSRKKRDAEGPWKGFECELGEGDCDWPSVMKAFDAIGYDDWFTAEIPGGDEARLRDIAARMDRILGR
jgi:hexulose-6-phosphate isomerase